MSILDTTVYFKSVYTQGHVPFENDNYNDSYIKDKNDNFCPLCHWNYKSDYHKRHCENQLPIGDELLPMFILISIYLIIKRICI
jgi:hypothetical protein